jgi:hypothetical protein
MKRKDRLKLIIDEQDACATCIDHNHGFPPSKTRHIVMEDVPWLIDQLNSATNKLSMVCKELQKIIIFQPVLYNGHADRAGDMEQMAQRLLAKLEIS